MNDDAAIPLLTEIRDLLRRTVANQADMLRANAEAMQMSRVAAQKAAINSRMVVIVFVVFALAMALFVT